MRGALIALSFGAFCCAGVQAAPIHEACQRPQFELSVSTHFAQRQSPDELLPLSVEGGFDAIRDEFYWKHTEKKRGQPTTPAKYDRYLRLAAAANMDVFMVLSYGNKVYPGPVKPKHPEALEGFANYSAYVARNYPKTITKFQVWNEWDHTIGGTKAGDAKSYLALLRAVSKAMREVNPDVYLVAGAATTKGLRQGWLEDVVAGGALNYAQAISFHPYIHSWRDPTPAKWIGWVRKNLKRLIVANHGQEFPAYISEMGWPYGKDPKEYLARAAQTYLLSRTTSVCGLTWYELKTNSKPGRPDFGLYNRSGEPRAALRALTVLHQHLKHRTVVWSVETDGLVALEFASDNGPMTAIWAPEGTVRIALSPELELSMLRLSDKDKTHFARTTGAALSVDEVPVLIQGGTEQLRRILEKAS